MQPQIARIFKNGRSQAVRLPKEFRFEENEVGFGARPVKPINLYL